MNDLLKTTTDGPRRRTMLVPIAYSESVMPALRLARSSRLAHRIAKVLFAGLLIAIVFAALAPWQQSISGQGNVIALPAAERQQTIESPIKGRIVRWGEGIVENTLVRRGDLIAEIQDLDTEYTARLESQLANTEAQVAASRQQLEASHRVFEATQSIINSLEAQVIAYSKVKDETIAAQDFFVEMAEKKVLAEKQVLAEYQAGLPQIAAELARTQTLYEGGNLALQKFQEIERKYNEQQAKISRASEYVNVAQAELDGKKRERAAKIEKAQVDIDYAEANVRKERANVSKAETDLAKAEQELNKAEKELLEMQSKVARQQTQVLYAPFDGYLVQITPNLGTSILKEGDPICSIVPDSQDRAVQLWLSGNDAPLVEPGRHVRLQFEGWPALQFAGWPSVAVGTFGGEVLSVDATDDGYGKFRVIVRADPTDHAWPEDRFLRQGVRANGWVLLEQVPLWFEIWRQLNGFPPVVDVESSKSQKQEKVKVPKLPKA